MVASFHTSSSSIHLPDIDHVSHLFDLAGQALNIQSLLDWCIALLKELEEGQVRMGVVKNIADFGVFVDLGGIDGLLHITDMSWGRVNHPSEMVKLDDEVEVKVLKIDHERERIALGMKQKTASPWDNIADKYPIGQRINGEVVNAGANSATLPAGTYINRVVRLPDGVAPAPSLCPLRY